MDQKFHETAEKAAKLLGTPAGKRLVSCLHRIPSEVMQEARRAFSSGDQSAALDALSPYLKDPEIESLLIQLFGGDSLA